jgi:hypothetical protein
VDQDDAGSRGEKAQRGVGVRTRRAQRVRPLRAGGRPSAANTDAPIFYYPKHARYWLLGKQTQHAPNSGFDGDVCLVDEPEHDDTCGPGWRVSEDVGKVQVQRDERALLAIAYVKDPVVWLAAKSLLNDGMSIVPGSLKYQRQ